MPDKLEEETAMKKEFFEWLAKKSATCAAFGKFY